MASFSRSPATTSRASIAPRAISTGATIFFQSCSADSALLIASTYRALPEACDAGLLPFDWYLALTLAGAHQHALPAPYIRWLSRQQLTKDPDPSRPAGQEALAVIRAAGLDKITAQRV